ncbi:c-type cytochrome [Sphingomonas sp. PL-96]|uniref:c-type cytochrome n=1 Tax=Sphingomonas sp. PL-96 TaxID=2887201 RepID=UPI001E48FDB3|nr:c-type cytochrome [Sphingomonas sp. PL-96]MCC2977266.1 c-type cytochrome [Sphingomonas sp. PL-96]
MTIRITWARAITALLALGAAGMLFAWSGLFNVAASSGHWAITDWFLHWTMRNSVRTHTIMAGEPAPRDDRGLVSAAGHFKNSCAVCHGAPGVPPSPVMQAATPAAPNLSVNAREWSDGQLFWIVEHGVKFTGMPAWAAKDRPDEIRRMVAFVRRLPRMTPAEYRQLTEQAPAAPVAGVRDATLRSCTGCHGADGRGRGAGDIPVLGGQKPAYLLAALRAYATGKRDSAVMRNVAVTLSPAEMEALARAFAAMPGLPAQLSATGNGEPARIVAQGLPKQQLPACRSCHEPNGRAPVLEGQKATYIADRLRAWRGEEGEIDARQSQATMPVIARRIPEEMIEPLAAYLEHGVASSVD